MTRNGSSEFTIYCEKSPFIGNIDCTCPNGVTVLIDVKTGQGALSDMFNSGSGFSEVFLSILICKQAQNS